MRSARTDQAYARAADADDVQRITRAVRVSHSRPALRCWETGPLERHACGGGWDAGDPSVRALARERPRRRPAPARPAGRRPCPRVAFYQGYCPHNGKGHVSGGTRYRRTLPRRTKLDRHDCSSSRTGIWRTLDHTLACRPERQPAGSVSGRPHPVREREPCPVRRSVSATETAPTTRRADDPGGAVHGACAERAVAARHVWSTGQPNG